MRTVTILNSHLERNRKLFLSVITILCGTLLAMVAATPASATPAQICATDVVIGNKDISRLSAPFGLQGSGQPYRVPNSSDSPPASSASATLGCSTPWSVSAPTEWKDGYFSFPASAAGYDYFDPTNSNRLSLDIQVLDASAAGWVVKVIDRYDGTALTRVVGDDPWYSYNGQPASGTYTMHQEYTATSAQQDHIRNGYLTVLMWGVGNTSGGSAADSMTFAVTSPFVGHSVQFSGNGASSSMTTQTATVSSPLTQNTLVRSGYTFAGWNTAADGSGLSFADSANYSFSAPMTLFAMWTPVAAANNASNLANTGSDNQKLFVYSSVAASALIVLGSVMVYARRLQKRIG